MAEERPAAKSDETRPHGARGGFARGVEGFFLGVHYISGVFVAVMTVITVIHAIGRYFFARPVPGLVEMCTFMVIPIIFFAAPYTELQKAHTVIPLVVDLLPGKGKAVLALIMYILYCLVAAIACWQSVLRAGFIKKSGYVSTVLSIPHYPFVFMVALGWLLLAVAALWRVGEHIKSIKEGGR